MIGIRCERGSHRFFKRYGERFEDSEGKRIFLEFADEEREHLELLIREYRALVGASRSRAPGRRATSGAGAALRARQRQARPDRRVIDLHLHTTASDGTLAPDDARRRGSPRPASPSSALTDHDTTAGLAEAAGGARARPGSASCRASRSPRSSDGRDVHVLGYVIDPASPPLARFSPSSAAIARAAHRRDRGAARRARRAGRRCRARRSRQRDGRRPRIGRPLVARALVAAGHVAIDRRRVRSLPGDGPAGLRAAHRRAAGRGGRVIARAGGIASLAHPGRRSATTRSQRWVAAGLPAIEVWHSDHDDDAVARYAAHRRALRPADDRRLGLPRRRHRPGLPRRRGGRAARGVRPARPAAPAASRPPSAADAARSS